VGRHRNDPLGHGRYVIAVGAVVLLIVLIVVAVFALRNALATRPSAPSGAKSQAATVGSTTAGGSPTAARSGASTTPEDAAAAPTLQLSVTGAKAHVLVRIPGGDILLDDTLTQGRHAAFNQSALDVVIDDGGAVKVVVNGKQRPMGTPGQREQFTARSA